MLKLVELNYLLTEQEQVHYWLSGGLLYSLEEDVGVKAWPLDSGMPAQGCTQTSVLHGVYQYVGRQVTGHWGSQMQPVSRPAHTLCLSCFLV